MGYRVAVVGFTATWADMLNILEEADFPGGQAAPPSPRGKSIGVEVGWGKAGVCQVRGHRPSSTSPTSTWC